MNALFRTTLNEVTEDWSRKLEQERENTNLTRRRLDERNLENIELTSSNRQYCARIEALETDNNSLQVANAQLETDNQVLKDVKMTLVTSLMTTKRENDQLRQQILNSTSCSLANFFTRKIKKTKLAADENANERLLEPEVRQNQPEGGFARSGENRSKKKRALQGCCCIC